MTDLHDATAAPAARTSLKGRASGRGHTPSETDTSGVSTTTTVSDGRPTIRLALSDGWARAALSGIEAALLGWALAVIPTLIGYISVMNNPWLSDATWNDALGVATDVWASVLGAALFTPMGTIHAVPTLMTLTIIIAQWALLMPTRRHSVASTWWSIPGFVLTALGIISGLGLTADWMTAAIGAIVIPFAASVWTVMSRRREWRVIPKVPAWVRPGLWDGIAVIFTCAMLGSAAALTAVIVGWERVSGIHALLLTASPVQDTLVIIAQLSFAPTFAAWALAWLAGPGFSLGIDAPFNPNTATSAPIPTVPIFGAAPAGTPGMVVILALVALGVVWGVWVARRSAEDDLPTAAARLTLAAVVSWVGIALWMHSAELVLGIGRMAHLGPQPLLVATAVTLEVVGMGAVVAIGAHPITQEWVSQRIAGWRTSASQAREERARMAAAGKEDWADADAVAGESNKDRPMTHRERAMASRMGQAASRAGHAASRMRTSMARTWRNGAGPDDGPESAATHVVGGHYDEKTTDDRSQEVP
ncbi:MAG: DUF6350 family protein [Actinomycetaceae bacterium]|nr:DUF6350 family protein [Actinomycetaceae bacterium]